MKRLIALSTVVSSLSFTAAVFADTGSSCHFHGSKPAVEATVAQCASQRRDALIKSGKLESSWQAIKQDKVEAVDGKKGKEWKITFRNPGATDKSKATLYLFFTLPGNFIAANFTGQ